VPGIDVSYAQSAIDWAAVARSGKIFAFIRVSDGARHGVDSRFADNWAGAADNGMYRGAYQYFRPGQDPIAQAELLLDEVGVLGDHDLPPALDLENLDGQRASVVVAKAKQWLDHVEAALGRRPLVYIGAGFASTLGDPAAIADTQLWVSNWGQSCPRMPPAWSEWRFWQTRVASGSPGIHTAIDLDVFNGTRDELAAFAAGAPR